jgi:hypothetical protein
MDWLHQVRAAVEKEIFHRVANLLNLEAGLLFFDTTSTYFEVDEKDEAVLRDKNGNVTDDEQNAAEGKPAPFRGYGKSTASPRTTATTCPRWSSGWRSPRRHPGARVVPVWQHERLGADPPGQDDMRDWTLSPIVWVAGRGFTSAENRRYLRSGDHHHIIGEKLRSGPTEADAALSRQGRYQDVTENLRVREVRISGSERFVICFNPEGAERDVAVAHP